MPIGVVVAGSLAGFTAPPAGAAGILPPANPPGNIAPSSGDWLSSIDSARAQEGVGPMNIAASQLISLPIDEQMMTVVNEERIDRGLPPINYVTSQLDAYAQAGANSGSDPSFPSAVTGGAPISYGGSVWAGGLSSNVLEADYYWMYDDGWSGSTTTNAACGLLSLSDCWGHRDIILHQYPNCPTGPPVLSMGAAYSASGYGGGSLTAIFVSSCAPPSDVMWNWGQVATQVQTSSAVIGVAPLPNGAGYWEAEANGTVAAFGSARSLGSVSGLNAPIVGIAATPSGGGYWLVGSDGGIFSFGDAAFYGSTGALRLNRPIVGMTSTPSGHGYWLVASDGGIFSYGDAPFYGSMGGQPLNRPIVGIADDPATDGYWEVATDGGIFSFNAPFLGSTGNINLNRPIVGMEAAPSGAGYRFVASDGGIFSYGAAPFDGSTGNLSLAAPVVGMAADNVTNGYWLAAADGGIFSFGGASFLGRLVSLL